MKVLKRPHKIGPTGDFKKLMSVSENIFSVARIETVLIDENTGIRAEIAIVTMMELPYAN